MRNSFTAHADRSDAIFLNPAVAGRFRKSISAGEGQCIIDRLISRIANIPVKKGAGNAGVEVVSGDKRIKCLHVSFPRKIAVSIFYFDSGEETVKLRSAEMCQSRHSGSVYSLSIPPGAVPAQVVADVILLRISLQDTYVQNLSFSFCLYGKMGIFINGKFVWTVKNFLVDQPSCAGNPYRTGSNSTERK